MGGIVKGVFGGDVPPPPPPPSAPPPTPTMDEARARRQAEDAARRKRGRAASVLTGPEGVGATPVAAKTLIGS